MEEKRLWELIAKKAAGEASGQELEELNQLLEKFPEAMYSIETIGHYWNAQKDQQAIAEREEALAKHISRFQQEKSMVESAINNRRAIVRTLMIGTAAAAALTIIGVGAWYFKLNDRITKGTVKTLAASNGTKNHVTLPDGSKVWLNAGSTLTYEEGFGKKKTREVKLSGEGFFEVRHDEQHPFVIHTPQVDIRDIGTSFNVKAYPTDKTTEATLIEGAIEVTLINGDQSIVLSKPNEKVIVNNKAATTITKSALPPTDSLIAETAWMNDMLVFRNETFGDLAEKMERWYDVTITFQNESIKQHKFTGIFSNETIEQALNELKQIYSFKYKDSNNTIVIY
ncbi:hypothetical protein A4H97_19375 [Niastella yeongjuensis]|uniref:Iron dicitrate transport regulator FecR n=1 Tax=Niastella yeongjuensis TaxID=354355 RepID=A0A1V9DYG7_9BACT|nr:FecR domain-containing protein [Niastella yeongjuensis]OQP38871.1 hypothetical protein A4H97_19375 [Niastella yeongjuensis]SEO29589.1 FecR family protein [Niastella yeongjuensis]